MYQFSSETNLEKHLEIENVSGGHTDPADPTKARTRAAARVTLRPSRRPRAGSPRVRPHGAAERSLFGFGN
jgi:hypothetical protein